MWHTPLPEPGSVLRRLAFTLTCSEAVPWGAFHTGDRQRSRDQVVREAMAANGCIGGNLTDFVKFCSLTNSSAPRLESQSC